VQRVQQQKIPVSMGNRMVGKKGEEEEDTSQDGPGEEDEAEDYFHEKSGFTTQLSACNQNYGGKNPRNQGSRERVPWDFRYAPFIFCSLDYPVGYHDGVLHALGIGEADLFQILRNF